MESVGDSLFGDGETIDAGGEARPFGAFEGEEKLIDVVETVFAAGKRGFDFLGDGE